MVDLDQQYRLLFDKNPQPMWVFDMETLRFLAVNDATVAHYGYSREEFLGMTVKDVRPPEDVPALLEHFSNTPDGLVEAGEWRHRKKDGTIIHVAITASRLPLEGRRVTVASIQDITERKRAEEVLRFSTQQFTSAFEHGAIGMALVSPTGRFLQVNRSLCDITGYSAEDLTRKTFQDITHPEDLDRDLAYVRQMLAGEIRSYQMEKRYLHKGGGIVWVLLSVSLVRDAFGQPVHFIAQIQDITGRILMEEALRETQNRYRNIIEAAFDAIAVHENGVILEVNEAYAKMFGYTVPEVIGKHVLDFVTPESRPLVVESVHKGVNVPYEAVKVRKDGTRIVCEVVARAYAYKGRNVRLAAIRDITARKKSEEEAGHVQALLGSIVEHSPNMFFVKDAKDLRFVLFNKAGEDLLGYRREELIGKNDYDFFPKDEADFFTGKDRETLARGGVLEIPEEPIQTKYKGLRYLRTLKVPILDREGRPQYLLGMSEDITDRKHLEEQLRQSQKMEAIGQLAGGMAHDFNNLLMAILGYSDLVLGRIGTHDSVRSDVEEIKKSGERAASLTRQLLAFGRRQFLQPKVMDLNLVVADLDRMLRRLIGEHIELVTRLGDSVGLVRVDPGQVQQVLMNLVLNARDAMPQGGRLTIETSGLPSDQIGPNRQGVVRPGSYAMLAVTDTGCGMDAETLARIFEPFYTTKEVGKGTGLGLSTVYGIVMQSGGCLEVRSAPGRGTRFMVYVPCVESEAEDRLGVQAPAMMAGEGTVLLVEDEAIVRAMVRSVLEQHGYRVLDAGEGQEAIRLAEQHAGPIHLLLSDIAMPHMSGPEVAHRLVSLRPDMKILFMSGYAGEEMLAHGLSVKGSAFLQKPVTPSVLLSKVREMLLAPPVEPRPS
ncbi:MAG: PAS domain S-box protein [Nitrospirota bacterium]|nr:PAS domain S-box protein [Nitrospirota bacterium]